MNYSRPIFTKKYISLAWYIKKYGLYIWFILVFLVYLIFTNQSSTTGYSLRQSVDKLDTINTELNNQSYIISELQKQLWQKVNININKKNIIKIEVD